jgi:hypothetical protein
MDRIFAGGPADRFVYNDVSESTSTVHDLLTGFNALSGVFDFDVGVTGVDATVTSGGLHGGNFDANLANLVGAGQLAAGHAVLCTPTAGSYTGHTLLVVDANGIAGHQAGQDYVIDLISATNLSSLSTANFT